MRKSPTLDRLQLSMVVANTASQRNIPVEKPPRTSIASGARRIKAMVAEMKVIRREKRNTQLSYPSPENRKSRRITAMSKP